MLSLFGRPIADNLLETIQHRSVLFQKKYTRPPCLCVIRVGEDLASQIYTEKKKKLAERLGIHCVIHIFSEKTPVWEVHQAITEFNKNDDIDGILIQRPVPLSYYASGFIQWIDPSKDVDGFHPLNIGYLTSKKKTFIPCTAAGVLALLKFYHIPLSGKIACVLGRSPIVGQPLSQLLLHENATVIQCHSQTLYPEKLCQLADVICVAIGQKERIGKKFFKPGCVIIDVGIHRDASGNLSGDVNAQEAQAIASALSPVPGGVGPLTLAFLMKNTMDAAEQRKNI